MSQYSAREWRNAGIGFVVLTVGGIGLLQACGGDDGPDPYDVQGECRMLVRDRLKNPTTAEFTSGDQSSVTASGLVAAENALGGTVTYTYRCTRLGSKVSLESLTPR